MKNISRRDFLKGAAAGAAGIAATSLFGGAAFAQDAEDFRKDPIDWLGAEPEIAEADIAETLTYDAVVIGAGTGGLECGSSLAEKGLKTLIIEQNADVSTVRNDFGSIDSSYQKAAGTVIHNRDVMNYHIMQNAGRFDQRLQKIWAEESGAAVDWVGGVYEAYGALLLHEGGYEPEFSGPGIPKFPTGHSGHFKTSEYPDGKSLLKQYVLDKGGEFRFNTKFVKFEHDGYKVTAAIAQDKDTGKYLRLVGEKGIVLAAGGYQNNEDMLNALQPDTRCLFGMQIGSTAYGDGIKACLWMGASMDDVHSTMLFDRMALMPNETQATGRGPMVRIGSQPWLKVNLKGERFYNESGLYDYAPHAAAAQPGRILISVFDANYWENIKQFETVGCSRCYPFPNGTPNDGQYGYETDEEFRKDVSDVIDAQVDAGRIVKADTLEELAEKMNLPVDTFVATVKRYNELCAKGEDEDFYKEAYRMIALETAPFYAFRNSSFALSTLDGVRVDTHSHPIDAEGKAFSGLYVIGDSSGSFFAYSYPNLCTGYAHGRTLTFARRVAREINGEEVKDYTIMATQDAVI